MKLTFLGGALSVTGSKFLIEDQDKRYLIDCGLFQGLKELRVRNWDPLPVDAKTISACVLTHAHLDHTGYLPILVKQGFNGPIYGSTLTCELTKLILLDAGRIQEEDADRANRYGYSKHKPALPLYTEAEAERAIRLLKPVDFYKEYNLDQGLSFTLSHSGHISGSSFITLKNSTTTIVFSGDVGRPDDPIMNKRDSIAFADYLLIESTYGGRLHPKVDNTSQLEKIINDTLSKKGKVIMASFAIGRAQTLLYLISKLKQENRIPQNVPVYLDSPMGQKVTELFCTHQEESGLSKNSLEEVCAVPQFISTREQSKRLKESKIPSIILASSGMAEGGRILHHLKNFGPDERNTVVLTGFQAEGTRGEKLLKGEKEIKVYGEVVPIRATITHLDNLSSHVDEEEMIDWLKGFKSPPKTTFLVHGEAEGTRAMKSKIEKELGWNVVIPNYLESVELNTEPTD